MSSANTREKITRLRLERGWSKARLARESGLNASDISRIELARAVPYPGQLRKLASALQVPLEELLREAPGAAELTRG